MIFRLLRSFIGITISAFAISCITNSGLGAFAMTTTVQAIASWSGFTYAIANLIMESVMIVYATYKGEGLGLNAIISATYGSFMIGLFNTILPLNTLIGLGGLLMPIGFAISGTAGLGDSGPNILLRALMKSTGKSVGIIRFAEDIICLIIGFFGARAYVSWFSLLLTVVTGPIMQAEYKVIHYSPTKIKHKFIIGGNSNE